MIERTTVAAAAEDLAVLRAEAQRRKVSLSLVLREAVSDRAAVLRRGRRPRIGIGHSGTGAAAAAARNPDEPYEAHPARDPG